MVLPRSWSEYGTAGGGGGYGSSSRSGHWSILDYETGEASRLSSLIVRAEVFHLRASSTLDNLRLHAKVKLRRAFGSEWRRATGHTGEIGYDFVVCSLCSGNKCIQR